MMQSLVGNSMVGTATDSGFSLTTSFDLKGEADEKTVDIGYSGGTTFR